MQLPPEIWSIIFEFAHGDDIYYLPGPYEPGELENYKSCFPEHVCSAWRKIALNTPYLWRHFTFSSASFAANDINGMSEAHLEDMKNLALGLMELGTTELTIELTDYNSMEEAIEKVQELTLPRANHLISLTVYQRPCATGFFHALLQHLPSLPSLRAFTVECYTDSEEGSDIILNTPLSDVSYSSLSGLHIDGEGDGIVLSSNMGHYLLSLCPQLKDCTMAIDWDVNPLGFHFALEKEELHLNNLETFKLFMHCLEVEDLEVFIEPLVLPSLSDFQLEITFWFPDITIDNPELLTNLLKRSGCKLKRHVLDAPYSSTNLSGYLSQIPSLVELSVHNASWSPSLLGDIATAQTLPRLEILVCIIREDRELLNALGELGELRHGGKNGADINALHIVLGGYTKKDADILRQRCAKQGRDLTINRLEDADRDSISVDSD